MFCKNCWHKNNENTKFCVNCGEKLEWEINSNSSTNKAKEKLNNYLWNFSKEQRKIFYISILWIILIYIIFENMIPNFNSMELQNEMLKEILNFTYSFRNYFIFFLVLILTLQFASTKIKKFKKWFLWVITLIIACFLPATSFFYPIISFATKYLKEFNPYDSETAILRNKNLVASVKFVNQSPDLLTTKTYKTNYLIDVIWELDTRLIEKSLDKKFKYSESEFNIIENKITTIQKENMVFYFGLFMIFTFFYPFLIIFFSYKDIKNFKFIS